MGRGEGVRRAVVLADVTSEAGPLDAGRVERWRRGLGTPGPWAAPALLIGSILVVIATVVGPAAVVGISGGLCELPTGDSNFGDMSLSVVPYGPVCEGADPVTGLSVRVGPSAGWTLLLVVGLAGVLVSTAVLVLRRRPEQVHRGGRRSVIVQVGSWVPAGLIGGALGTALLLVAGTAVLAVLAAVAGAQTWWSWLGDVPGLALSGALIGGFCGLVLSFPAAGCCIYGERRGWRSSPAAYGVIAAALAAPGSLLVTVPAFGLMSATGALVLPLGLALGVAVVALPLGVVAHRWAGRTGEALEHGRV